MRGRRGEWATGRRGDVASARGGNWGEVGDWERATGIRFSSKRSVKQRIRSYRDLRVYQTAMDAAMRVFEMTKTFPAEEKFSMVDQMRRCSRSVCTNIGEAWRKRRYAAHFISKLSDSEGEAEETRVWLEFAWRCHYIHTTRFWANSSE
ncbi:MAG TPA: four helix bundle protein [Blastocatellia bacterium]|nr:four helix bundle protein [Blastocatellia bacterium]